MDPSILSLFTYCVYEWYYRKHSGHYWIALAPGFGSICGIQSMPIKFWYFGKPLLVPEVVLTGCFIGGLHYSADYYIKKKASHTQTVYINL